MTLFQPHQAIENQLSNKLLEKISINFSNLSHNNQIQRTQKAAPLI